MEISKSALSEVEAALKKYCAEVLASDLSQYTHNTYTYHASTFVRWLKGDFTPGSRVNPYQKRKK